VAFHVRRCQVCTVNGLLPLTTLMGIACGASSVRYLLTSGKVKGGWRQNQSISVRQNSTTLLLHADSPLPSLLQPDLYYRPIHQVSFHLRICCCFAQLHATVSNSRCLVVRNSVSVIPTTTPPPSQTTFEVVKRLAIVMLADS